MVWLARVFLEGLSAAVGLKVVGYHLLQHLLRAHLLRVIRSGLRYLRLRHEVMHGQWTGKTLVVSRLNCY